MKFKDQLNSYLLLKHKLGINIKMSAYGHMCMKSHTNAHALQIHSSYFLFKLLCRQSSATLSYSVNIILRQNNY